jgi:hypothetical protein
LMLWVKNLQNFMEERFGTTALILELIL